MNDADRSHRPCPLGAIPLDDDTVRFSVWAPHAKRLAVRLHRTHAGAPTPLTPIGDGYFEGVVRGAGAGDRYMLQLDEQFESPDPVSRFQPDGIHGPSLIVDPRRFDWTDQHWPGRRLPDLILYELHVGAFTAGGTFEDVINRLDDLRDLGVTGIELMPVAEFPGHRNWGYDGVFPFAPHHAYGGPEGLRRLVNAAHAADLAVVLDVVYNHLGPEGNVLARFGPYFSDDYATPWGQGLNFDGPGSHGVRRYVVENALYWLDEFHFDGLRLDAVHAIRDESRQHILQELAGRVHAYGRDRGRPCVLMAESDANDPRLVREAPHGGYGLDGQFCDDFHRAVHAALTGEFHGFYADFGGLAPVTKVLRERFALNGCHSRARGARHGAPAADVPRDRLVVFLQNHDQVGNRPQGDRLSTLVSFEKQKLGAALLLLSPYVPLIFMGEEYGETNPFLYFVDYVDRTLRQAIRLGRGKDLAAMGWSQDAPDPGAIQTFDRSRLDLNRAAQQPHQALRTLYRDLLRIRRSEPVMRPGCAEITVHCEESCKCIWWRFRARTTDADLLAVFNLDGRPRDIALPATTNWKPEWESSDARYLGRQPDTRSHVSPGAAAAIVSIPAESAALFRSVD